MPLDGGRQNWPAHISWIGAIPWESLHPALPDLFHDKLSFIKLLLYRIMHMAPPFFRLAIEPLPYSSRRASLANLLPRGRWDRIRRHIYRRARYHCQICGREGRMFCHETWRFNEQAGRQYLIGFEGLCEACHKTKHYFFTGDSRARAALFQHLLTTNRVTRQQGIDHLMNVYRQQQRLNQREWIVDYGRYNWHIPATATVEQRRTYARFNHPRRRSTENQFGQAPSILYRTSYSEREGL